MQLFYTNTLFHMINYNILWLIAIHSFIPASETKVLAPPSPERDIVIVSTVDDCHFHHADEHSQSWNQE